MEITAGIIKNKVHQPLIAKILKVKIPRVLSKNTAPITIKIIPNIFLFDVEKPPYICKDFT